jgi:hypothetical protein
MTAISGWFPEEIFGHLAQIAFTLRGGQAGEAPACSLGILEILRDVFCIGAIVGHNTP